MDDLTILIDPAKPPTARDLWKASERVRRVEQALAQVQRSVELERLVHDYLVQRARDYGWSMECIVRAQRRGRWVRRPRPHRRRFTDLAWTSPRIVWPIRRQP